MAYIGQIKQFKKTVKEDDVNTFATITGDNNPLHLNNKYASESRFGRRICHGVLVEGLISACLNKFEGDVIYVSKQTNFVSPAYLNDELVASCEVVEELDDNLYKLETLVKNSEGSQIVTGTATILID